MLWYKSWIDTRWRFLLGLALLVVMAAGDVFQYTQVKNFDAVIDSEALGGTGVIGRAIGEAIEAQRTYRGYVWYNWFTQGLSFALFAALLGSGSPLARSGRGLLFALALPASRRSWLGGRAAMGLAELFTFALVPALVFPMLSPSIGEQYALADALVHGLCVFVGASTLFALALLLSTVFDDLWRPLLITCLVGMLLALGEMATPELHGLFTVMSGEAYFESGSLPWAGLLIVAVVTAALLYGAAANLERRDF